MKNCVPAQPIAQVVAEALRRNNLSEVRDADLVSLAQNSHVSYFTIARLIRGKLIWLDFDVADRLLCGLNLQEEWVSTLADIYNECDISGPSKTPLWDEEPQRCAHKKCGRLYYPDRKGTKYCCLSCATIVRNERRVKSEAR